MLGKLGDEVQDSAIGEAAVGDVKSLDIERKSVLTERKITMVPLEPREEATISLVAEVVEEVMDIIQAMEVMDGLVEVVVVTNERIQTWL